MQNSDANNFTVHSNSFYLKTNNQQLLQRMNYKYDGLNGDIYVDVQLENNCINFYAITNAGEQQIYNVTGLIQYYVL